MPAIPARLADNLPRPAATRRPVRPPVPRPARWARVALAASIALLVLLACWRTLAPSLADNLASHLPPQWVRAASEQTLAELDQSAQHPSMASLARQSTLSVQFARMSAPPAGTPPYRLVFRASAQVLALSLPNGDIVISDGLLARLPDDQQVLAILCRELGHLNYQHALRTVLSEHLAALIGRALLGGDDAAIQALAGYLLTQPVSERFADQANAYARAMLTTNGLPADSLNAAQLALPARP